MLCKQFLDHTHRLIHGLFIDPELEEAKTFAYLFVSLGIACHFVHNEIGPKMFSPSSGEAGHMVMDPSSWT